jgi:DUF1365 family protein
MSEAALYVGAVMHRRLKPVGHRFRYRCFWLLFELGEIDSLCRGLRFLSHNRFNLFSISDRDHGDGSSRPLRTQIEDDLAKAGIRLDGGKIYLLCMPRSGGYSFNPLSVYFCRHADGTPAATVYEVHNTFGERHRYVIASGAGHHGCAKAFYVSPFLDMDMSYRFALSGPGETMSLSIRTAQAGEAMLFACMHGQRRAVSDAALLRCFLTLPLVSVKVILAIHWEALRLWLKGLRLRPHVTAS